MPTNFTLQSPSSRNPGRGVDPHPLGTLFIVALFGPIVLAQAANTVQFEHRAADSLPAFQFESVPRPARNDAAAQARFRIVTGERDSNSGRIAALQDGRLPSQPDEPAANFFFRAGSTGGRLLCDLGAPISVKQVDTYSWHPGGRGPQVYTLYGSDGQSGGLELEPAATTDPLACGWNLLATVDTRSESGEPGGQYGVSISNSNGPVGVCRYLLFQMAPTDKTDPFGQTFFSEIDVVDRDGPKLELIDSSTHATIRDVIPLAEGRYTVVIDTSETPDLTDWTRTQIIPMVQEWYPKLIQMLPSKDFSPPPQFSILFDPTMRGVAATSGTRIRCAASWIRANLQGEARGAIFHEMVHVLQQYGRSPRSAPNTTRPPGWLVEGIADYMRWYKFEPESHGAEITSRNLDRARYDASYRITANFLNWGSQTYGEDLIPKINAAIREHRFNESIWTDLTGHSVQELGATWKNVLAERVAPESSSASVPQNITVH